MYNPQLETFLRVADAGSFNKAAEEAYITPTAVIKQINLLENSLDVKLFERTHRGLILTKAGKSLYQDCLLSTSAELLVEKANQFVIGNMGEKFRHFVPFVAALFATSVVSNLISLLGLRSPTADLSTEAAWAVVVFVMITYQKIKAGGVGGYFKGFTKPILILTPFNILSELATPISMACRHFGNILSGVVINALLYLSLIHIWRFWNGSMCYQAKFNGGYHRDY